MHRTSSKLQDIRNNYAIFVLKPQEKRPNSTGQDDIEPDRTIWGCGITLTTKLRAGQRRKHGSSPSRSKRFSPFPKRPDKFWGPPSFLIKGKRVLFMRHSSSDVTPTIYVLLNPKLGINGARTLLPHTPSRTPGKLYFTIQI